MGGSSDSELHGGSRGLIWEWTKGESNSGMVDGARLRQTCEAAMAAGEVGGGVRKLTRNWDQTEGGVWPDEGNQGNGRQTY